MSKLEYKTNKNHLNSLLLSEESLPVKVTANKVDLPKLCRTCLCNAKTNDMNNKTLCVVTGYGKLMPIYQLFETATGSKFDFNSKMPHHICGACLKLLNHSYTIRTQSQRAEGIIRCIILAENEVDTKRNYVAMKTNTNAAAKTHITENPEIKNERIELTNDRMEQDGENLSNVIGVGELKMSDAMSTSEGTGEEMFIISVQDDEEGASLEEQSTNTQDPIECTFCKKAFLDHRELILHNKRCKADVKTVAKQSDEFPSPTRRFRKPGKIKHTIIQRCTKQQNQQQEDLRKATVKSPKAADAIWSRKKIYYCPNCDQKFQENTKLKEHMLTHTQNDINKFYHCMQCVKQWTTQQGWLLHMNQHQIEADKQERHISKQISE